MQHGSSTGSSSNCLFARYHFEGGTFVPVGWENVASHVRDVSILIFARRSAEIPRIELRLPCNAWESLVGGRLELRFSKIEF